MVQQRRSGRVTSPIRTVAKAFFSLADLARGSFGGPRILIYHQIGAGNGKQMDLSQTDFSRHIDYLTRSDVSVVSLDDAVAERNSPGAATKVVLTFDDGYDDMYRNAYPLLLEKRMPFTLYLTTKPTETGVALSDDGRSTPITWDQVNEMLASGLMTLGAHTHSHPDFRSLSAAEAEEEVVASQDLIERRTGVQARHFAYPWGYWGHDADPVVRAAYETATLGGGSPIGADTDLLRMNRIPVQLDDGFVFFKRKLKRGQRTEEFVRRRLSGYDGP